MKITLHPPVCLHEMGKRKNNEDYIYPSKKNQGMAKSSGLFLVCDGVGGSAKGEEASKIVCEVFSKVLVGKKTVKAEDVAEALKAAEDAIDEYTRNDPESKGMATTLTLLSLHKKGVTIAHLGDSRVYQIRGNEIIFRTNDHSFVNELVSNNIITEAEAREHPKRNVVTKAIVGAFSPQVPDVEYIEDVHPGDYFFLCTDGILESIDDEQLVKIISKSGRSDIEKVNDIYKICNKESKDNFSSWLLQIDQVVSSGATAPTVANTGESSALPESKKPMGLLIAGVVLVALMGFWMMSSNDKSKTNTDENGEVNIELDLSDVPESVTPVLEEDEMMEDSMVPKSATKKESDADQSWKAVTKTTNDLEQMSKSLKKDINAIKENHLKEAVDTTIKTNDAASNDALTEKNFSAAVAPIVTADSTKIEAPKTEQDTSGNNQK